MAKVNLFFDSFADSEIVGHTIIRLKCGVQLKTPYGWSKPYSGIIDTGAHLTAIPSSMWEKISFIQKIGKSKLFGLSKRKECALQGELAIVTLILIDEMGNQTPELKLMAFLAETDQIPLILGFNGLLEKVSLHLDYAHAIAYIEE